MPDVWARGTGAPAYSLVDDGWASRKVWDPVPVFSIQLHRLLSEYLLHTRPCVHASGSSSEKEAVPSPKLCITTLAHEQNYTVACHSTQCYRSQWHPKGGESTFEWKDLQGFVAEVAFNIGPEETGIVGSGDQVLQREGIKWAEVRKHGAYFRNNKGFTLTRDALISRSSWLWSYCEGFQMSLYFLFNVRRGH